MSEEKISNTTSSRNGICASNGDLNNLAMVQNKTTSERADEAHFPGISFGYAGVGYADATLNSQFFFEYWKSENEFGGVSHLITYPLRVPRRGFFDELHANESKVTASRLKTKEDLIKSRVALVTAKQTRSNPIETLNALGLALRYGIFKFPSLDRLEQPRPGDSNDYRISLQLYIAKLSSAISDGIPAPFQEIKDLSALAYQDTKLDPEIKAQIFNRYLVASARHSGKGPISTDVFLNKTSSFLISYLKDHSPHNFREYLSHSSLWRGVSMWAGLNPQEKTDCLVQAENLADLAEPQNVIEQLLSLENRVTLFQTLSKWHGRNDPSAKVKYVQAIMELDPSDSTAYSELGLHYYQTSDWQTARKYFQAAIRLGPPALAMNTFFMAETELKLGMTGGAEETLKRAALIDPVGLSPRLSLINLFKEQNRLVELHIVRNEILGNIDLQSQLINEELQDLVKM